MEWMEAELEARHLTVDLFTLFWFFIRCAFITYLESKIGMGGRGAIRAYVKSKGRSR